MTVSIPKESDSRIHEPPYKWCKQCDYHNDDGPGDCLTPGCEYGPFIGHCQVILGSEDDYLDWMRAVSSGSPGP